jgi:hypothetical protein
MAQQERKGIVNIAFGGIFDFFKSGHQLMKARKANRIPVEYIDLNGLVHTGYYAVINDEKTLSVIRGINRLNIVTKIYTVLETKERKIYVYEGNTHSIDLSKQDIYEKIITLQPHKDMFMKICNEFVVGKDLEKAYQEFSRLKASDLGFTINFDYGKNIPDKEHDWSAMSYLVASKQWFSIGNKETPIQLIAMGIIGMLFGAFSTTIIILFLWFVVEVLRILIK